MTEIVNGIIINSRAFREHDVLITLYTKEQGRIEAVARGARKITAKLRSHAQILSEVQAMIAVGKSIKHLAACYSLNLFPKIRSDYDKVSAAWVFLEVFQRALPHSGGDENIYKLLTTWLEFLDNYSQVEKKQLGTLSLLISSRLLVYLGSAPQFAHCVRCGADLDDRAAKFTAGDGGRVCDKCFDKEIDREVSDKSASVWRYILETEKIDVFLENFLTTNIKTKELDKLNSLVLDFIEHRLEYQLQTRKYFI